MSQPEPVTVDVGLESDRLTAAERTLLECRIASEAGELIRDLRLPAVAQVRITQHVPDVRHAPGHMRIVIDGQQCRQSILSNNGEIDRVSEVVNVVSFILRENRHLLLTRRVLGVIAMDYPVHVAALAPRMVRLGLSLDVAVEIARRLSPNLDLESRNYQAELLLTRFVPESVTVEAGAGCHRMATESSSRLSEIIGMMRDGLFYELGLTFPPVRLAVSEVLPPFDFRIGFGAMRGPVLRGLADDDSLVSATVSQLADTLAIAARPARNPTNGVECAIVSGWADALRCEQDGKLTVWDATGYIVLSLSRFLRKHAPVFLNAADVQAMLAKLSEAFPLLIVDVLERFAPRLVLDVVRALVREEFSVRDLRGILEALLEFNGSLEPLTRGEVAILPPSVRLLISDSRSAGRDAAERYADSVRVAMRRYVTSQFAHRGDCTVLELSGFNEEGLRACAERNWPLERSALAAALAAASEGLHTPAPLVLLTSADLRRRVRAAIEIEYPDVAVLGREELDGPLIWREHRTLSWSAAGEPPDALRLLRGAGAPKV